jgi:hypothetical protein
MHGSRQLYPHCFSSSRSTASRWGGLDAQFVNSPNPCSNSFGHFSFRPRPCGTSISGRNMNAKSLCAHQRLRSCGIRWRRAIGKVRLGLRRSLEPPPLLVTMADIPSFPRALYCCTITQAR